MRKRSLLILILLVAGLLPAWAAPPTNPQQRLVEILQLIRANHLDQAEALATKWADAEPNPLAWYGLGTVYYLQKNYLKAFPVLEKCLNNPYLPPAMTSQVYLMLGRIELSFKKYDQAITYFYDGLHQPGVPEAVRDQLQLSHDQAVNDKEYTMWRRRDTAHIVFFYRRNPELEAVIDKLATRYNDLFDHFVRDFKIKPEPKIRFYYFDNKTLYSKMIGDPSLSTIYLREQLINAWSGGEPEHQFMHLLIYRINQRNYPSYLIAEGMDGYLMAQYDDRDPHLYAAILAENHNLPTIKEMDRQEFFEQVPQAASVAGSFCAFLAEHFGQERFMKFWGSSGKFDTDFPACFGYSAADCYEQWKSFLTAHPVPAEDRLGALIRYIVEPGLYSDGISLLNSSGNGEALHQVLLASCYAGSGRFDDARSALKSLDLNPRHLPADLSTTWQARTALLAGQLADLAGQREVALGFYRAVQQLDNVPSGIHDTIALRLQTPATALDLKLSAPPDPVKRAEDLIRYHLALGMGPAVVSRALLERLDAPALKTLFRNADIALPAKKDAIRSYAPDAQVKTREDWTAEWDRVSASVTDLDPLRVALKPWLDSFYSSEMISRVREAGVSVLDIATAIHPSSGQPKDTGRP